MKNISVNNSIIRNACKPALKALQAILSLVSSPYAKLTVSSLKPYLKEGRTAINSRLSELAEVQAEFSTPAKHFTLILESVLLNPALSLSAKGIYMMIRSFATFAGFVITKDYFYKKSGMYYKTFDRAWKELQTAGLIASHQHRSITGKFIYTYSMPELESVQSEACTSASEQTTEATKDKPEKVIELTAEVARLHKLLAIEKAKTVKSELPLPTVQRRRNSFTDFSKWQNAEVLQKNNFKQRTYSEEYLNSFVMNL